jgi:hypothetical protein
MDRGDLLHIQEHERAQQEQGQEFNNFTLEKQKVKIFLI